jgi:hypothetical protein
VAPRSITLRANFPLGHGQSHVQNTRMAHILITSESCENVRRRR